MHLVTVTVSGAGHLQVILPAQTPTTEAATTEPETGPSPIAPEKKELLWGAGAFIVLAILVRFFLFPRLKKGMDAPPRADPQRAGGCRADPGRGRSRAGRVQRRAGAGAGRGQRPHRRRPPDAGGRAPGSAGRGQQRGRGTTDRGGRRGRGGEGRGPRAGDRGRAQVAAVASQRVLGRPVDPAAARAAVEGAMSVEVS